MLRIYNLIFGRALLWDQDDNFNFPPGWIKYYAKSRYVVLVKWCTICRTTEDPTEHVDLADQLPDVVQRLNDRINEYMKQYVTPNAPPNDPDSNPNNYGDVWSPGWCWETVICLCA